MDSKPSRGRLAIRSPSGKVVQLAKQLEAGGSSPPTGGGGVHGMVSREELSDYMVSSQLLLPVWE